jgi:large subunit ribosomal protein L22
MPQFGYSFHIHDNASYVRASGREVDVSPKMAREVCESIKGLSLDSARTFLEEVADMKRPVAYRRFKLKRGHRKQLQGFPVGGYPTKCARVILGILENLQNNAEHRGMNTDKLRIIHAAASAGRRLKRFEPRAFGRSSPSVRVLTHIELVAKEVP